jgi:hypothetical protein
MEIFLKYEGNGSIALLILNKMIPCFSQTRDMYVYNEQYVIDEGVFLL